MRRRKVGVGVGIVGGRVEVGVGVGMVDIEGVRVGCEMWDSYGMV